MKIYLDGLARSGNVFLSFAVNSFFGDEVVSERTHGLSSLKKYKPGDCFIVPVRDALPALASNVVYIDYVISKEIFGASEKSKNYLDKLVSDNLEYLEYLVDNQDFFIAPFEEIINDHISVCKVIAAEYPELNPTGRLQSSQELIKIAEETNEHLYNPYIGNVPRNSNLDTDSVKEMLLATYAEEINQMQNSVNILYERYYTIKKKHNL
jgi:hypothetical protein